jgi:hypothetical protein
VLVEIVSVGLPVPPLISMTEGALAETAPAEVTLVVNETVPA